MVEWLEYGMHPWTSFVIASVFALANAGISIDAQRLREAMSSRVSLGIIVGLVVGKLVGVTGAACLAVRFRVAALPEGLTWFGVVGVGALAGVRFTVSLFIANLAFDQPELQSQAKIGIFATSLRSGFLATVLLRRSGEKENQASPLPVRALR